MVAYLVSLTKIFRDTKGSPLDTFIITDASIKNDKATAVSYIWVSRSIIHKTK